MRKIDLIVIHCTATREDKSLSPAELDRMHRQRGFNGCGYHYYVRRDGEICSMRPVGQAGAHAKGHNANSIGIAYEGGLDAGGNPADTRTEEQKRSIRVLVRVLCEDYRIRKVVGHRDLSPDRDGDGVVEPEEWIKLCPCWRNRNAGDGAGCSDNPPEFFLKNIPEHLVFRDVFCIFIGSKKPGKLKKDEPE